jgi:hypothetical protein
MISAHKFLLPLAGCLALMPACGDGVGRDGGRDSNASDGNVVDSGASPDTGGTEDSGVAADSGQAGSDAGGSFRLEVVNGFGSGVYAAGSTVHVWSAASTTNEVALPWSGDSSLLAEPNEWHSSFVMPARNVTMTANRQSQPVTLTVETFNGSTSRPKTVRYHFPRAMRGVVLFSHGTGGSSTYIQSAEAFALALALVQRGYGVVGTEAEEAVAGDLNGDGKQRWFSGPAFRADNVDLRNMQLLFASFEMRGLIPAGTPKFALGMSNGGAFSHYLGTVGSSPVAGDFPQLRFRAIVGYCADASGSQSASMTMTPSAWFMCGAEDNPDVSNTEARANSLMLMRRSIPTDYIEHPPSPLYDERFTRIEGISVETSRAMVAELRAAGFVDASGFVNRDGDSIGQFIVDNPTRFPTIVRQRDSLGSIRSQVKVVRAEHSMYADYAQRNIAFFDRFNPAR